MQMDTETGVVETIHARHVTVLFDRKAACKNCKACGLTANPNQMRMTLPNKNYAFAPGDTVRVIMDEQFFLGSSFLLYVIPLMALLAGTVGGWVIGQLIFPSWFQAFAALCGIGLTALYFLFLRVFKTAFARSRDKRVRLVAVENAAAISPQE